MKLRTTLALVAVVGLATAWGAASSQSAPVLPGSHITEIDGRGVETFVHRHDQATHTLVFENGSRNCIQRWETLLKHLPAEVNIYLYNRPGYCNSATTQTLRDSKTIVDELRRSLRAQGLNPPYVLVGHSLGGLYMQHFARAHPAEVQGLVLIDALHPGVLKDAADFPWYTRAASSLLLGRNMKEEIYAAHASGTVIDALPAIDHLPIVRLFNDPKRQIEEGKAQEVDLGMINKSEEVRAKVRGMYPRAKTVVAESSHQMQETSPELVVQAIQEVMLAKGPLR